MKKFLFKSAILALAAPFLLASCSSDSNEPNAPENNTENFEGIMLSLPNLNTRGEASSDEYAIHDLRVLVYKIDDGTATLKLNKELTGDDVSGINNTSYTPIPIVLGKGTYRMYLVANASGYTLDKDITTAPTAQSPISEDNLKAAKITGVTDVIYKSALTGTTRKYLPMACAHSELKESENAANTLGSSDIVIDNSNPIKTIYADLTFAVAKVHCTMINNATSAVQLTSLKLNPYTTSTGLVSEKDDNTVATSDITIQNKFFNLNTEGTDVDTSSTLDNPAGKTWGWQNDWYICENLYADSGSDNNKTKLTFTFSSESYDKVRVIGDNDVTKGVKRGYVYNIKGTISKKELTLKVSVKEWNYSKRVIDFDSEYEEN